MKTFGLDGAYLDEPDIDYLTAQREIKSAAKAQTAVQSDVQSPESASAAQILDEEPTSPPQEINADAYDADQDWPVAQLGTSEEGDLPSRSVGINRLPRHAFRG